MTIKNNFPYPKEEYAQFLKDTYADINGLELFQDEKNWESQKWSAAVNCSRGKVLEKAGFCILHVCGGTINEIPASVTLFQTLAYPANPRIPGFIIMTNMNETKGMGKILVSYLDLIIQDGNAHEKEKKLFSDTARNICSKHGHNYEEYHAFLQGRNLLGGSAGECGLLCFLEEKDMLFADDLIRRLLTAYRDILEMVKNEKPHQEDFEKRNRVRARLVEWIITEDYGVKVARENGIPLEVLEAYAFPPVVHY